MLSRVLTVLTHPTNLKVMMYLAATLLTGLVVLYDMSRQADRQLLKLGKVSNLAHRKLFHVLAFLLYAPMHALCMTDRKVFELLLLSQNWVTVFFIYIELVRFSSQGTSVGDMVNAGFTRFTDEREFSKTRLLLTHLYLLIGLGLPTNLTYIILDGGFPDGEMAVFAFSGVIFLGIGDTMAALFGRYFGTSPWRSNAHKKTQEGTIYSTLIMCVVYYIFCAKVYAHMCAMFAIVAFATVFVAIAEGLTTQFDNLVCPAVYFVALHQIYDYFIYII